MKIFDRQGNSVVYDQSQNQLLKRLYGNVVGRCILKVLTLPFVTHLGGKYMNSSLSKRKISSFVQKNHIDLHQYEKVDYKSYNEFFTRKILPEYRPIDKEETHLIAPADSKVSYYPITSKTILTIKDTRYTIEELLQSETLAKQYQKGVCLIFRLTVDDYHRYSFIDEGTKEKDVYIPGVFHTVNPIANDYYPIYKQNSRSYSLLHTKNFGDVIYMEVGALMVGKICNHDIETYYRGQEKGYFEFGGSTIVMFFKENQIVVDKDIIFNSLNNYETKVQLGEKIGVKKISL